MKKIFIVIIILGIAIFIFYRYFKPVDPNPLIDDNYRKSTAYINDLYKSDEYFKHKLLKPEDYYIYETIIKSSIDGIYDVKIPCTKDCNNKFSNSYNAIYLDHPELISFTGFGSYRYSDNTLSYQNYANLDKTKTYLGTKRIAIELDNVRKETAQMSDKDKIIYTYNYIASHDYDQIFTFTRSNQSAYSFFTKKTSVCAGFAKASQLVFQNIGINSKLVMSNTHMWNYVEYNGKWYIFDATYGASYSDKTNINYYDGLGLTTISNPQPLFAKYYPKIETTKLKDIFKI